MSLKTIESVGSIIVTVGTQRIIPISSNGICVPPFPPAVSPGSEPIIRIFNFA